MRSVEERLASLETEAAFTRSMMEEMRRDIKAILETVGGAKGGWKLMLALIAIAALFGTGAQHLIRALTH